MATKENCPAWDVCGFVKFLKEKTETEKPDCGKNPRDCGRLDPFISQLDVAAEGAVTRHEVETAFPTIDTGEHGQPRRIIGGTHR